MAKYAPVAPLPILQKLADRGVLGTYHLLLAHDVVKHPHEYEELFNHASMYVIMDNSLIELGHPVEASVMRDAMAVVNADVGVLPDCLGNCDETIRLVQEAYPKWIKAGITNMQAVVQGTRMYEINKCYNALRAADTAEYIAGWSVPKVLQKHMGTRASALSILRDYGEGNIHLLGFSDDLNDDIFCCLNFKQIVNGIDSAVPVRLGTQGIMLDRKIPEHAPRGNWMETAKDITPEVVDNIRLTRLWMEGLAA